MEKHERDLFEIGMSYSCLYSLLVKKGVITSDEYIEHSKLLKEIILAPFKDLEAGDEFTAFINEVYADIAAKAK